MLTKTQILLAQSRTTFFWFGIVEYPDGSRSKRYGPFDCPEKAAKIIRASNLLYNTQVEVKVIQEVKQHPDLSPF